jgi:small basic protein
MIWAIIGVLVGVIIGLAVNIPIPIELTRYTAVVSIGILDAIFGAIRAEVTKDNYDAIIFLTGLFFNVVLAIAITFLGDKLGLDLYLAATVVFTFRIFTNVGITRRSLLQNFMQKRKQKKAFK